MSHSIVSSLTSLLNYFRYSYWYKIHVRNVSYIIYIIIQKPFNIHISFFRQRSFSFSILFFVIMYFSFIIAYHTFMINFIMFITAMFEKLYLVQASTPCDCCPQPLFIFSDVVVISPSVLLPSAEWQVIQCANIKVFLTFSIFKGCSTSVFTFFRFKILSPTEAILYTVYTFEVNIESTTLVWMYSLHPKNSPILSCGDGTVHYN